MTTQFEPQHSNFLDDSFSNIGGGRRKECKARGLKGKAFRDCVKELKVEDKGLSREEKKAKKKERKIGFQKALVEGKVEKGKVLRKIQKFNPAALALRGTVLSALRFNIFGNSTRLYPALITEQEAKDKNFDLENLPKAREAMQRVKAFFIRVGGNPVRIENVVRKAHDKPILNTKKAKARKAAEKKQGIDGSGETYSNLAEESIIAISTASAGVLTSIIAMVGAKKNPYKAGSPQANKFDAETKDIKLEKPPVGYERVIKEAEKGAEQDKAKGLELDKSDNTEDDKILGMDKGIFWSGIVLLSLGAAFAVYKMRGKGTSVATK